MKKILGRLPKWLKICLGLVLTLALAFFLIKVIPNPTLRKFVSQQYSTRFYDSNGILLNILPLEEGLRREYRSLEEYPQQVVDKFISEEDKNFFHHIGIDLGSIIRAARQNQQANQIVSGASTITMQLSRIIYPRKDSHVSLKTKIGEMFKAFYLEIKFSKKQILELYLNNVPFGYQIEGVTSAARSFFGVEPALLTSEQIDTLAIIPRRPSVNAPEKTYEYPSVCQHFINYVVNTYKENGTQLPAELHLSIDSQLILKTEELLQQKLEQYKEARIHNGAAFAIDNRTGQIILWVGNASYLDTEHAGQIDGVLVKNQPGSSMKPFLYAHALENGFQPNAILPDIPQDFGGEQIYVPFNFNNRYNGPISMRVSLASSLNVPAVYLLYHVGVDSYLETLKKLKFTSLENQRDNIGLSLALGGNEVTLYEMVRAFSSFPRDGNVIEPTFSTQAQEQKPVASNQAFKIDTARIICDFLSDKNARSLGFGHSRTFETPYPAIFKTGTSNQFQNIIALGATSEFTVGVWMGNFEGETVIRQTGSSIPASIVRDILDALNARRTAQPFQQPVSYTKVPVCTLSGMDKASACPTSVPEYIQTSKLNSGLFEQCNWHIISGNKIKILYPSEYQHWSNSQNFAGTSTTSRSPLEILYPKNNATYFFDPTLSLDIQRFSVKAYGGTSTSATLFVDGKNCGKVSGIFEWFLPLTPGDHLITVRSGKEESSITIHVKN